jgi:D-aminopeptidase
MSKKLRGRQLGLPFPGVTGPHNAITDVPGVEVGYTTIDGKSASGKPIKTGVTAILPRGHQTEPQPTWAGFHSLNGNGEMTGVHWVEDAGYFVGPICVTNTQSVGMVHHGATRWMIRQYAEAWSRTRLWAMPIVAETFDGEFSDIDGLHITEQHVLDALDNARPGPVAEGNVGGGNGSRAYKFKAGTGTSSRKVQVEGRDYTVAALVQANHGVREVFNVLGVPVGQEMPFTGTQAELGSIIVIIATDAPLLPHQLRRVAKRGSIGIGRNGTFGGNSSGDLFLAFSTANPKELPQFAPLHQSMDHLSDNGCDPIYIGAVQSIEEAVINALLAAEDTHSFDPKGGVWKAIDHDALMQIMRRYNRVAA